MQLSELNAHRHTAATRFGEISYLDLGAGPTALFVHGIATNAYLWRHVMDALSGQRRCIAIDLPLHGQSPVTAEQDLSLAALAAGLDDFCEVLGLTGIDLVANDTGGAIAQISFASGYEHVDLIDRDVIRSYLQPCFGTIERARQFERLLVSLRVGDLQAVMPQLGELTVPTLVVWGTGDAFFDVSWAYWLRDTIPGTTRVVTVDGARMFFPEERPMDLVPHLEQHWAAVGAARA